MQSHRLLKLLLALLPVTSLVTFQGCNSDHDSTGLSGSVTETDFVVAADERLGVTGDLNLNATGTLDIAGILEADSADGQGIALTAEGDILISGTVRAGDGAAEGQNGGDLIIESRNGNITLAGSAVLAAGDGGTGQTATRTLARYLTRDGQTVQISRIEGGSGGKGGSITLRAPNGILTLPDTEGAIHVGNGGAGQNISVQGDDLLTTEVETRLTNGGGDSGWFHMEATQTLGPAFVTHTLPEDVLSPDETTVIFPAGTVYYEFPGINPFSGGNGGPPGDLYYGVDENEQVTWPATNAVVRFHQRLRAATWLNGEDRWHLRTSMARATTTTVKVEGAGGSAGIFGAGDGQDAYYSGAPGNAPGKDGESVSVHGGMGGYSLAGFHFGFEGKPGNAWGKAGDGANGSHPSGDGGNGGYAFVASGIPNLYGNEKPGWAFAKSGNGGNGGENAQTM